MNNTITTIAAVALAIATGFVVAQTTPNPAANAPPPAGTSPPPTDAPVAPRNNMTPTTSRPGMPTTQMPPDFGTLDRTNAGFITQKDAAENAWLSRNFATCDTDHNMQVSRAEYDTCTKQPTP
jgi:hypothetical protein